MNILEIAQATVSYRKRTGNASAATRVKQGKIQLVSVTYPNGKSQSKIDELSGWMPISDFCAWINDK